jgi:hypothetical protein
MLPVVLVRFVVVFILPLIILIAIQLAPKPLECPTRGVGGVDILLMQHILWPTSATAADE